MEVMRILKPGISERLTQSVSRISHLSGGLLSLVPLGMRACRWTAADTPAHSGPPLSARKVLQ